MNRCRIIISSLTLIATMLWATAQAEELAQPEPTQGFALPEFTSGYPDTGFEYEGADAKRLAIELFPAVASQIVKAIVREQVGIPGGGYHGLYINLVLEPRVERQSICEQPRIAIMMRYNSKERFQARALRLVIHNGSIAEHDFETVYRTGRYRSLAEKPESPAVALEACRELAGDTAGWKAATDASDFAGQQWRQQQLFNALETLPSERIKCIGIDGKRCKDSRNELLSYFRATPAHYSEGHFVPGAGEVSIFSYAEADLRYDVTMWQDKGKTRSVSIRFSRPTPVVI